MSGINPYRNYIYFVRIVRAGPLLAVNFHGAPKFVLGRGLSAPPLSHKQLCVNDFDGRRGRRMSRKVQRSKRLFQLVGPGCLWCFLLLAVLTFKGPESSSGFPWLSLACHCQRTRLLALVWIADDKKEPGCLKLLFA